MNPMQAVLAVGTIFTAVGLWLLMPRGGQGGRVFGGVLTLIGMGCFASQIPAVGDWFASGLFYVIAGITIVGAVATITFRSPVYCAIWFGLTLSGTAGLFLLAGAEFLAAATIVVYAGAILVTFLFVLMLSEPEGFTTYDRRSWEAVVAAPTGAILVGILTITIATSMTKASEQVSPLPQAGEGQKVRGDSLAQPADRPHSNPLPEGEGSHVAPPTIAAIGAQLFTRYLVAVEAAGALLFAALVGAAVIVAHGHASRTRGSGPREGVAHAS